MANRHRVKKFAEGGGVAPSDSPENVTRVNKHPVFEEAASKSGGFKGGGKVRGKKGGGRLDKRARGGRTRQRYASGGGVLSTAANVKTATKRGSSDSEDLSID